MKRIYTILTLLTLVTNLFGQAPQKMSYQAIIRNSSGALISSTLVGMKISVLQGSANGNAVFVETHTKSTNANGLISLEIGTGNAISGIFGNINWANGPYFIKTETDPTGSNTYTIVGTSELMSVPYALFSANAAPGPQGPIGLTGATGPQGATGTNGTAVLNDSIAPTNVIGNNGDFYINTASNLLYGPKVNGAWPTAVSLVGPQGIQGAAGPQGNSGTNGSTVLNGNTSPTNSIGNNGDFYIHTASNLLYGPKANGTWPTALSLVGPQGIQGAVGPQGSAGTNGSSVLNGNTSPTNSIGNNGDFYINTASNLLYGPKTNGTWPTAVSLVGPQGIQGSVGPQGNAGINGSTVLNGNTSPTNSIGNNGDFYINTTSNLLYGPKANGTWPIAVSLVGPQGIQGATGPQGPIGGFTHYIGEAFNGGRIFYLYKGSDGLEHGLIVALTESTAIWQTSASLVNANRTEDGAYNTNLMTGSPAATYIASLGSGWYLPSIDELILLFNNRFLVQKALRAGNNTLLSNTNVPNAYWSSTEFNSTNAHVMDFYPGTSYYTGKNTTCSVRGVKAF